jgi:methionyl-tRNA formyltransferase
MRLVFAGTPEPAVVSLRRLLGSDAHEVVAVVTRPDAPAGRRRTLQRSPVGALADEAGIEVLTPARASDPEFLDRLRAIAPDCCPVVAYGTLLRPAALAIPEHGWVNLHFSLLPAWRGAAPVPAAIRADEGMDTGPVFGTVTEKIADDDTAGSLLERLSASGAGLLAATLDGIADGSLDAVAQPAEGVSVAPKVTVEDARVRWTDPPLAIDRTIRSVTPAPGAWTEFRGQRVKIGPVTGVTPPLTPTDLGPGELHVEKRRVLVGTAAAPVALGTVQPAGKPAMPAVDWTRGAQPAPGERFA